MSQNHCTCATSLDGSCPVHDEIERLRNKVSALLPREGMPPYTVLLQELSEAEALLVEAVIQGGHDANLNKKIDAWLARREKKE